MRRNFLSHRAGRLAGLGLLAAILSSSPQEVRLPVTADNTIWMVSGEREYNTGRSARLRLKGIENVILLDFDPAPLRDKVVTRARLRLRGTQPGLSLRRIGFSTVASPWPEGVSEHTARGAEGDSCFLTPELGRNKTWAGPGSNFLDVLWGRGGTIWAQGLARQDAGGWVEVPVDGRILEACAAGLSHGIAVSDDTGQVCNVHPEADPAVDPNHGFFSREQRGSEPHILVTVEPRGGVRPSPLQVEVTAWPGGADFESGGLEVSWPGPRDEAEYASLLGYRIRLGLNGAEPRELPRWMHPAPARPGERARALLRNLTVGAGARAEVEVIASGGAAVRKGAASGHVSANLTAPSPIVLPKIERPGGPPGSAWAIPDLCKANPVTGNVLEEEGVEYEGKPAGKFRERNPVWSGAERSVSLSAVRGEWTAFQVVCEGPGRRAITPSPLTGPGGATIPAPELSRAWYQKSGVGWYADPLLPLKPGAPFSIPDEANGIPGQTNQTIYVEFFVPKNARPGTYAGRLQVDPQAIEVRLEVSDVLIPDTARFVWSMNGYGPPGHGYGKPSSEGFLAAERAFYAMAHAHRTTLAILHYSHSGNTDEGCVPSVSGRGRQMRVSDWSAWDRRFGPLFDGSAFRDTPREGIPLDHFYLALCEHHPTSMAEGYKWNSLRWEDHWKTAGPVEEGFSREYQEQWVAVASDYLRHIREKGWKTSFQVYLNDKYYYKQYDPRRQGPGRGVCFWLLDEPAHLDDYLALAFFGRLLRQAQAGDRDRLVFRVDLSRPQFARDTLDRVMDLDVSGGFTEYRRLLEDWRERRGQRNWTYGAPPPSRVSALTINAQTLDLYGRGVDGFVPWCVLGTENEWKAFSETCVIYTGRPMGIQGPCASLRLKACRRGEQDVELLGLLAAKLGLLKDDPDRLRVARLLSGAFRGNRKTGLLDAQGAVTELLTDLRAEDFETFRRAVTQALSR
jgi:hypothetical protein